MNNNSVMKKDSPCLGFCSTSMGDKVCVACGRTDQEVIDWIIYTDEEKEAVWTRLINEGKIKER